MASSSSNTPLDPWVRGPFELVRHAHGHLKDGNDTDRRIALIGFDNAVEVCIDVFLRLHPKLRKGVQIQKVEVEKAVQNYHTKLEFLDKYVADNKLELRVPLEAILWYHQLRNELYHSGNGMVPEMHVLEGAREAALSVFFTLFGVELAPLLNVELTATRSQFESIPFSPQNDQMEFLRVFIEFERLLTSAVAGESEPARFVSVPELWRRYSARVPVGHEASEVVRKAVELRNKLAHGHAADVDPEQLVASFVALSDLSDVLRGSTHGRRPDSRPGA